ncbi:MAG TPA: hypothetical protein PKM21_04385 [Anaerolineales bacterium]|nr:hypothetical protein [Anaerolineales bacterium]
MFNKLKSQIVVHVTPEAFTFSMQENSVSLPTRLYVSLGDKPKIIAIGQPPTGRQKHEEVALFSDQPDSPAEDGKFEYLKRFIEYGIRQVMPRASLPVMLPRVLIQGIETLEPVLHGYQKDLLKMATILADVDSVSFG